MSTISNSRSEYWTAHFADLAQSESARNEQLDFSNHALVVQNYAYILEACGAIAGKRILDAGFGTGDLSRTLDLLGGRVTAFDVVSNRIPHLREAAPGVAWWKGDLGEWTLPPNSESFDLIVACESLQYVEFDDAVHRLLEALSPGGRLVILIPNSDCPIVQRTSERFDDQYLGVSMGGLASRFLSLIQKPRTGSWYVAYRGLFFQADQTLVPYRSGPWKWLDAGQPSDSSKSRSLHSGHQAHTPHGAAVRAGNEAPANRLQIVISRPDTQT